MRTSVELPFNLKDNLEVQHSAGYCPASRSYDKRLSVAAPLMLDN